MSTVGWALFQRSLFEKMPDWLTDQSKAGIFYWSSLFPHDSSQCLVQSKSSLHAPHSATVPEQSFHKMHPMSKFATACTFYYDSWLLFGLTALPINEHSLKSLQLCDKMNFFSLWILFFFHVECNNKRRLTTTQIEYLDVQRPLWLCNGCYSACRFLV